MSGLKPYLVTIYGITHTVLLSDADAKKRGLSQTTATDGKSSPAVQDKMRTPDVARRSKPARDDAGKTVHDKAAGGDD